MKPFTRLVGLVAPLDRANVDTDAIIPKQFLKAINRTGFGPYLFDEWRYFDHGEYGQDCSKRVLNKEFVLNQARYQGAEILLTGANFGCGSSREHAPWALLEYGFRVIIAPSFADIFYNNCCKNGILPVILPADVVRKLFTEVVASPGYRLDVDLPSQTVKNPAETCFRFEIDQFLKYGLLQGMDEIALTLRYAQDIQNYESRRRRETPWLFPVDMRIGRASRKKVNNE
ncbi:MAG: 3-isopropylmalate dehydratase small subunit [Gammaproteobacteria bacterium]|jgi:3-isopropylmalate/(R)-2-methylmalate dehydratase small subunit